VDAATPNGGMAMRGTPSPICTTIGEGTVAGGPAKLDCGVESGRLGGVVRVGVAAVSRALASTPERPSYTTLP
jgi:hypothetical protein